MDAKNNVPAPILLNNWVLYSILDDSDPCYHSDALSGQTPAQARKAEAAMASTTPARLVRRVS